MKIYFSASISQMSPQVKQNYQMIVKTLEDFGHSVIADHVLGRGSDSYEDQDERESLSVQRKLTKWKKQADLVVVEVSNKSFGVGQEIALAVASNKPVIALYNSSKEPHILRDAGTELILLTKYNETNIKSVLKQALDYSSEQQDIRFNFFISPTLIQYLDWVSKTKRVPRSVYLRKLIEEDMQNNEDYNS